jgi:hypothetical protein
MTSFPASTAKTLAGSKIKLVLRRWRGGEQAISFSGETVLQSWEMCRGVWSRFDLDIIR